MGISGYTPYGLRQLTRLVSHDWFGAYLAALASLASLAAYLSNST